MLRQSLILEFNVQKHGIHEGSALVPIEMGKVYKHETIH